MVLIRWYSVQRDHRSRVVKTTIIPRELRTRRLELLGLYLEYRKRQGKDDRAVNYFC